MRLKEYETAGEHLVTMGNYENVKLVARAVVIADEDDDPQQVIAFAREIVEKGLRPDMERAMEVTAEPDTYLDPWLNGPPPPVPVRRARRIK